ncbi:uncharacterized protein FOMMEDRAFT_157023 [Fomitiporia mediterranea MF3/22]|uniref:uncharacterized protein n=1 Tax=Fomitiporia mediterranea (strain MF3/22) TaxID=694068 RepID=UPI0004408A52|nr:uncharacterized protein FOMMEDRAFT_157023 [Fomitiporia mediterranea MF3/22]EJD01889.1 hypothetical protein FOMMEDRAFT_157023 [Fomitiporia mediterranea MF3/22]
MASFAADRVYKERILRRSSSLVSIDSLATLLNAPAFIAFKEGDHSIKKMGARLRKKSISMPKAKTATSYSTSSTSTAPAPLPAPSISPSRHHSISSALHNVACLPRKASRLMCIGDPSDPNVSKVRREGTRRENVSGAERASVVHHAGSNSGSDTSSVSNSRPASESSGYNASSSCVASHTAPTTPSSTSISEQHKHGQNQVMTVNAGPIISPEELARALSCQSIISSAQDSSKQASSAPQKLTGNTGANSSLKAAPVTNVKSIPSNTKSKNVHNLQLSSRNANHGPNKSNEVTYPTPEEDPIPSPRPLSPPPEHFRRRERVLSASGQKGPYASPIHSPDTSPSFRTLPLMGDDERAYDAKSVDGGLQQPQPLRLHNLLSSESLIETPLSLYNGELDQDSDSKPTKSSHKRSRNSIDVSVNLNGGKSRTSTKDLGKHFGVPASALPLGTAKSAKPGPGGAEGCPDQNGSSAECKERSGSG